MKERIDTTVALDEIFGFIGGTLICSAMVPQVWRLFKLKSAREISLFFTIMLLVGGIFWLTYGIVQTRPSIIYANTVSFVLASLMLIAKLKWGRTPTDGKHS